MNTFEKISPLILQTLIWIPTRLILWVFSGFKVSGLENLKGLKTGVIFAANHSRSLDPIVLPAALPFFSRFMPIFYTSRERTFYKVKAWWEKILYSESWFNAWGAHKVVVGQKNFEIALEKHIKILKSGKSLFIFPEGGTTKDGKLKPGKPGIAYLADKLSTPVVPVAIEGNYGLTMKKFFRGKANISVTFGKPVYRSEFFGEETDLGIEDYKKASALIMSKIAYMLAQQTSN